MGYVTQGSLIPPATPPKAPQVSLRFRRYQPSPITPPPSLKDPMYEPELFSATCHRHGIVAQDLGCRAQGVGFRV